MSNTNEDFHYEELVNNNIQIAKSLYNLPEKQKNIVKKLLLKKEKIKEKNGFFAEFRIERINKKILQIREVYNEKK